ncbi:MAG: S8 family serine peptidase [Eubacteriales bacterium]|nr:S8 family serine peptidase [Eubacteriales bacterium]
MKRADSKLMALLLSLAILLSSFGGFAHATELEKNHSQDSQAELAVYRELSTQEEDRNKKIEEAKAVSTEQVMSDNVRIIVELEKEPVIEEAIRQGISYAELSEEKVAELERAIAMEQENALLDLQPILTEVQNEGNSENLTEPERKTEIIQYSTGFNGLAMTVKAKDVADIEKKPYVKRVYLAEEYERPQMNHSNPMIGSAFAWETLGLKGEGIVVAVIDTGIDYTHSAMVLENPQAAKYNEVTINRLIAENGLKGKYFTAKVPYGYNYYDHNDNTFDSYGVMHGMHVAGIIGANVVNGGEINGVAPNVQLLAMKVFSDDRQYPTTFTDIWLKAFDDAIALKADVINMSLGSPAGLASTEDIRPEDEAMQRAKDAGIVVTISAGNDGNIMSGNSYGEKPRKENPDIAVLASPSVLENSISVASVENGVRYIQNLYWQTLDGESKKARINIRKGIDAEDRIQAQAVHIGFGEAKDYENKEVANKIALISLTKDQEDEHTHLSDEQEHIAPNHKGSHKLTLEERIRIAESKNVKAILLYNDLESGEHLGRDFNAGIALFTKTIALVGYQGGQEILEELAVNPNLELELSTVLEEELSLNDGLVSPFSSWGPTPDLRIKPELAAPGGNIYSTIEENTYRSMSGTSMASPHVAGASAILKQFLLSKGIDGIRASEEIKLRLMNTAKPIRNQEGVVDFVRKQGAGLLQLDKALKTQVLAKVTGTNDRTEDGKLEIKAIDKTNFDVKIILENRSEREKTFEVSISGITDLLEGENLTGTPQKIANFSGLDSILSVPAGQSKSFEFNIDFSLNANIEQESFIEGYIQLKDLDRAEQVDLSLPFLMFYGDWDKPKAIDAFKIKELDEERRKAQFFTNKMLGGHSSDFVTSVGLSLPTINDVILFMPDIEKKIEDNYFSNIGVRIAALRNMKSLQFSILDGETGKTLKTLGEMTDIRKLSRLTSRPSFAYLPESLWNGEIEGEQIPDNKEYIYQIKAKLNNHFTNPGEQIYRFKLKGDSSEPVFGTGDKKSKLEEYNGNRKKITICVKDSGSGLERIYFQSLHFKKRMPEANGEYRIATPSEIGNSPDFDVWRAIYGKSLKINFDLSSISSQYTLPVLKVENGRLIIPENYLDEISGIYKEVFCDLNGHLNEEIVVETYYDVDEPFIGVFGTDRLKHTAIEYMPTGTEFVHRLSFDTFHSAVSGLNGILTVNGQVVRDVDILANQKSTIRLEYPDNNAVIKFLKISTDMNKDVVIKDGIVDEALAAKYNLFKEEFSLQFEVEPTAGITTVTVAAEEKGFELGFSEMDFEKFAEKQIRLAHPKTYFPIVIKSNSQKINVPQNAEITIAARLNTDKKISNIYVKNAKYGFAKSLIEESDVNTFRNSYDAYIVLNKMLNIKFEMTASSELVVIYEGEPDPYDLPFPFEHPEKENLHLNPMKYPAIFIRTPNLLELKKKEHNSSGISVSGFVGYVDEDGLSSLTFTLIDNDGNVISSPISYPVEQLKSTEVRYVNKGEILYQGMGYEFELEMDSPEFLVNIKVEAITKNGKKGSMVRRAYYDSQSPTILYNVKNRQLKDDTMTLYVKAEDDSFRLRIYQNGSFLGGKDLSAKSLQSSQVSFDQKWQIPLKIGQNKIELKVVDAAGRESSKVIYVYRTER